MFVSFEKVKEMAKSSQTPFYIISNDKLKKNYLNFKTFMPKAEVYYAVKANHHPDVIATLAEVGCGFEVASAQEMQAALDAKVKPEKILFGNPSKRKEDIILAKEKGVKRFVFDSEEGLEKIAKYAPGTEVYARISVDVKGSKISLNRKFGADNETALRLLLKAKELGLKPIGVSFHPGSQCLNPNAYVAGLKSIKEIFTGAEQKGLHLYFVDVGGGFPAEYDEKVPELQEYTSRINEFVEKNFSKDIEFVVEPGRYIVADAFLLVTRVINKRVVGEKIWYYLDAGVYSGFMEVPLYKWVYPFKTEAGGAPKKSVVAGPTCDEIDIVYEDIMLPKLAVDDLLVVEKMGAYSYSEMTEFNGFQTVDSTMFTEILIDGYSHNFKIQKVIFSGKTRFQQADIIKTKEFGKILFIDRKIQLATKDEFIYHDNLVHAAMFAVEKPEKVLIIGGGDGGTLRTVTKHRNVKEITLVDLDKEIIELSKKYLPEVSNGAFEDQRLKLLNVDGMKFVDEKLQSGEKFDVVIIDLTEPSGPSTLLWTKEFYERIKGLLSGGGVMATHSDTPFFFPKAFAVIGKTIRAAFPQVMTQLVPIPSFGMSWSFTVASKKQIDINAMEKRLKESELEVKSFQAANFRAMPSYAIKLIEDCERISTEKDAFDKFG